jgi:predicted DNA-binding transcriptional regulator AlpA
MVPSKLRTERRRPKMSTVIPFRYIRKKELLTFLGVSKATLERDTAKGDFPKPYPLGRRIIAWRSDEVLAYLNSLPHMEDAYSRHDRQKENAV